MSNRPAMTTAAMMSIKPHFAEAILRGEKSLELRRQRPGLEAGTRVLIYASAPVKAVVGWFEVGQIQSSSPERLWRRAADCAGVTREEFDAYFAGCELAIGIEVAQAGRVEPTAPGIRPPQSWQYLRETLHQHRALIALAQA
jgi:predicted transcriptional regulator